MRFHALAIFLIHQPLCVQAVAALSFLVMPRTCWAFPPPWAPPFTALDVHQDARRPNVQALICLARSSLRKGHRRVAIQRCLMLQAAGHDVPEDLTHLLTDVFVHWPLADQRRVKARAESWAVMLSRSVCLTRSVSCPIGAVGIPSHQEKSRAWSV